MDTVQSSRDVTNFIFTFDDVRVLTNFQLFNIRRIAGSVFGECKYFILFNLTELWMLTEENTTLWMSHFYSSHATFLT